MARALPSAGVWASAGGALVLALAASSAKADGFEPKPLSLRLPAAMSRFATYGDVTGAGGASAGSKWSSSINPASIAWEPMPGRLHLSVSPQYSNVRFRNDMSLDVAAEALTWNANGWGTFQPTLAQVRSNREETRQGVDFRMDMDLVQVQWAKRVCDDWALGANFNFTKAKTRFDLGPLDVSDCNGETYGFRLGTLNRLARGLLGGVVFDYAFSPSRTTLYDFMGTGTGDIRTEDTGHQYVLRPGLSYEYLKNSCLYADYQFGTFRDDSGRLQVSRFYTGVDHAICKWLFIRGGAALDTKGNAAWTTGVGIYPTDRFSIDVGYQDNMFPELEPEFGRSRTLTISVSLSF